VASDDLPSVALDTPRILVTLIYFPILLIVIGVCYSDSDFLCFIPCEKPSLPFVEPKKRIKHFFIIVI
jgi:hypothetical protein